MNRLEKIARDLAAVLSPKGEADWPRFLDMAKKVGSRLDRQFAEIMTPGAVFMGERSERSGIYPGR